MGDRRPGPATAVPFGGRAARFGCAGSVTAELALALPAVVLVLALLLATGEVVGAQLRCTDAARAGARLLARGEPVPVAEAGVRALAPAGSRVELTQGDRTVTVRVSVGVSLPLLATGLHLQASAAAPREQP